MKVCIAGSRNLNLTPDEVWDLAMDAYFRHVEKGVSPGAAEFPTEIIHGGARGVDTLAGLAAAERGIKVRVFEANWTTYGKGAGHMRNITMATEADLVIAIWDGKSTGTKHMVDFCRRCGRPIEVIEVAT